MFNQNIENLLICIISLKSKVVKSLLSTNSSILQKISYIFRFRNHKLKVIICSKFTKDFICQK